jgi:hypothetical protein
VIFRRNDIEDSRALPRFVHLTCAFLISSHVLLIYPREMSPRFSDDKLAVVFAQSWRVGQRYNGGKQIR